MDVNKTLILRQLKEHNEFRSDAEFARFLGISPQNLAKWYARNTFDVDKVVNVFPDVNIPWLLTGEGPMMKSTVNSYDKMADQDIQAVISAVVADEMMKLLVSGEIYSAEVHDKIVATKDKEIALKGELIEKLQRENWELQKKLEDISK